MRELDPRDPLVLLGRRRRRKRVVGDRRRGHGRMPLSIRPYNFAKQGRAAGITWDIDPREIEWTDPPPRRLG